MIFFCSTISDCGVIRKLRHALSERTTEEFVSIYKNIFLWKFCDKGERVWKYFFRDLICEQPLSSAIDCYQHDFARDTIRKSVPRVFFIIFIYTTACLFYNAIPSKRSIERTTDNICVLLQNKMCHCWY